MSKISTYLLKYWYAYAFGLLCMIISISLDMIAPQITRHIIDDVVIGGNLSLLTKFLIGILIVGVGRCIFQYAKEYIFDLTSSKIAAEIRKNLFHHIQSLSMNFFDRNNTGELMARVKDDVDRIWEALGFVGMLIMEVILHTGIVLFCMYKTNVTLAILPTLAMPVVAFIAIYMERKLGTIYGEISQENAALNTVAEENLAGVRTVKAFAREKYEIQKFLSHNNKYYELNMRQSKVFVKYYPYFQFITKLLPITIVVFGGYLVIQNQMTLGELGAFTEYSMNIVWPMEMLGWLTNSFSSSVASGKKIGAIYQEQPSIKESKEPVILPKVNGTIEFCNVSFRKEDMQKTAVTDEKSNEYSSSLANILTDISFKVEAGKTIGIMGATGAGKTSIIHLLQRLYDATEGNIYLDDVNVRDLSLKELRGSISLVMQDIFLFSDTITENIKLGKKNDLDYDMIRCAADNAQAHEFINKMDKKYETIIGERGVGLSGGQKQRISIARALSKKNPILILDDSTSALDMETEHLIQKALAELTDTTKIIIAHRISAVRNADEIIILDNGSIAERGTHETLLAQKGFYYNTFMAQYGEYLTRR